MKNLHKNKLIFLKTPKSLCGPVEIREFKNKEGTGIVLLSAEKTYRVVVRENSNTFLLKSFSEQDLREIKIFLECKEVLYGEREILKIIPEVDLVEVENSSIFISKERIFKIFPLTDFEYENILRKNRCLKKEISGSIFFAKVSKKSVIEVLLLIRSLIISKETKEVKKIEEEFKEILPPILFQLVYLYVEDQEINEEKVKEDIFSLFKETSGTEEEYKKNLAINCLLY